MVIENQKSLKTTLTKSILAEENENDAKFYRPSYHIH